VSPTSVLPKSDETLAIAQERHRAVVEAIEQGHGTRTEALAREHGLLAGRVLDGALGRSGSAPLRPGRGVDQPGDAVGTSADNSQPQLPSPIRRSTGIRSGSWKLPFHRMTKAAFQLPIPAQLNANGSELGVGSWKSGVGFRV
jgi:hypothetical protein